MSESDDCLTWACVNEIFEISISFSQFHHRSESEITSGSR
jgi:hypothetical protein